MNDVVAIGGYIIRFGDDGIIVSREWSDVGKPQIRGLTDLLQSERRDFHPEFEKMLDIYKGD